MDKKVSIITASYNYEKYIKETIESVINQTFQNWEMIIVDDGSIDNSVEIIKSYCEKDNRIKLYLHKDGENKGLAETLKLGIEKAQSEWIVFLESDDTITPDYLLEKFNIVNKYKNVDFVFNDVNMFGEQKIINKYRRGYLRKVLPVVTKLTYPTKMLNAFQESENDNLIPTFSAVMLRKKLLEGIDFNSPIKPYLDWFIWLQIVNRNNCEFYYIDKQLTNWRMHKHSYISTKLKEKEIFIFGIKKSIFLFKYSRLFKTVRQLLKLFRRRIIRLHFNEGETIFWGEKYKTPILSTIYSKNVDRNKVKYKILGIKISIKIKNKRQKFNINEINNKIKEKIRSNSLEYVSFDIFDTLLVRPCIHPTDIFALLAEKVDSKYGIDFYSMRINAENGVENANIYEIYDVIRENYNLSEELKNTLLKEEIELETKLLYSREDLKEIYDLAVENDKKIIAVSDMYLPSDVLLKILKEKGYDKIENVYVSNEYNARKDNGKLFDIVIDDLGTDNILHIGDNEVSDYSIPISKNMCAIHYPKIIDILSGNNVLLNKLINSSNSYNIEIANRNVFVGYILNNYWFNNSDYNLKMLNNLEDFANLFLAPYICYVILGLQRNTIIQNLYNKIYFVARDGYLPNKIYNILNFGRYIPSEYIYGSRVAYWTGTYSSIYDLLKQQYLCFLSDYTFEDFINAYIADEETNRNIKEKYSEQELNLSAKDNFIECYGLLNRADALFKTYYDNQKQLAQKYYDEIFKSENDRIVVFDVGYSGSISMGLSKLTPKTVDKIYIHETLKNIFRDNKYQTYTYILKNGIESNKYSNLDLLLEECFSPLEGTCTGFKEENNKIIPTLDKMNISIEMKNAHQELNETSEIFARNLIKLFGEYFQYLNITDINPIIECIDNNFKNNADEKEIFRDIVFNDTATRHNQVSLKEKIKE